MGPELQWTVCQLSSFPFGQILEFRTCPHSTVLSKSLELSHGLLGWEVLKKLDDGEACVGGVTWALEAGSVV